jgi:hypothetical protein
MPFTSECSACGILVKAVADDQENAVVECPRCKKSFTARRLGSAGKGKPGRGGPAAPPPKAAPLPKRDASKRGREDEDEDDGDMEETQVVRPRRRRDPVEEPEEEVAESSGSETPWFAILGVVAFVLGSTGLALASFNGLQAVAVGVTLVGLALGGLGFFLAYQKDTGTVFPLLGLVVCVPALIWGLISLSSVEKPEKGPSAADLAKKTVVPLGQRNAALSEDKPMPAAEGDYVDASHGAVQQRDLRIAITRVSIGTPVFQPQEKKKAPTEKCLIIELRVTNVGVGEKFEYSGWGEWGSPHAGMLHDTKGKAYKMKKFDGGWEVKGQAHSTTIFPGKKVDDILVFEGPPPKTSPGTLRLELPSSAFGGEGRVAFEIPSKMISTNDGLPTPAGGKK